MNVKGLTVLLTVALQTMIFAQNGNMDPNKIENILAILQTLVG